MTSTTNFDAIVIGSGISGGWAAKELTEKGLRVLVLERGKPLEHGAYYGEHARSWQQNFYSLPDRELIASDYPVQGQNYAFSQTNSKYWNNDRLNPYLQTEGKPFNWFRADIVGGRSVLWGRQTYRWSEQDFQANKREGNGLAWPVEYADIAPWYSYVERFAGISGAAEAWPELPDGEFLPPMEYYALEKVIKRRINRQLPDVKVTMGRCAVLTQAHNGRAPCHYCGPCHDGCSSGSYFSSQSATLPAAHATGRLTLLPNQVVTRLLHNEEGDRVNAVQCVDAETGDKRSFQARLVFLCASTVASTQILLNSGSKQYPNGLANRSGVLGKYLMDHAMMGHMGVFVDKTDSYTRGSRPNGLYIPRFRNLDSSAEDTGFVRGYGFQAHALRTDWQNSFNRPGFGAKYKDSLAQLSPYWIWALGGFQECLPYESNRISLHPRKTDRFGMPLVVTEFSWGANEKRMAADECQQAARIFRAAGAVHYIVSSPEKMSIGGTGIHEMGTARMGDDPNDSVLNKYNQTHDLKNLFVTDGSFMTSASCVNPSLSYMAFTARACDYAVRQLNEGIL